MDSSEIETLSHANVNHNNIISLFTKKPFIDFLLLACDSSCLTCSVSSTQCTSCNGVTTTLSKGKKLKGHRCIDIDSSCGDGFFLNNASNTSNSSSSASCDPCASQCLTCDTASTSCTACKLGMFALNSLCLS